MHAVCTFQDSSHASRKLAIAPTEYNDNGIVYEMKSRHAKTKLRYVLGSASLWNGLPPVLRDRSLASLNCTCTICCGFVVVF